MEQQNLFLDLTDQELITIDGGGEKILNALTGCGLAVAGGYEELSALTYVFGGWGLAGGAAALCVAGAIGLQHK